MPRRRAPRRMRAPRYPQSNFGQITRDTMDITKMAVGGAVGIGMINAVGSIIPKP